MSPWYQPLRAIGDVGGESFGQKEPKNKQNLTWTQNIDNINGCYVIIP